MIVFRPARSPEEAREWERAEKVRETTLEIAFSIPWYKDATFAEKKFVFDAVTQRVSELMPA